MEKINFLHFSDLHIGDNNQKGLISQTKSILFEDIEFILKKLDSLDIVFFSGDLVQKGHKNEFKLLEAFLQELWALFSKHSLNPYLICVPGNHDLERIIDPNHATNKVLINWINDDIKNEYFWKAPNDYHNFIIERFANYTDWHENTLIKKPENICMGFLPGDFYTTIIKNNSKLGVVGLNTSFLQLYGGDAKGKLGVYNKQIYFLFKDKYFEWLKSNDLSILLTHHHSAWFEPNSKEEFHNEIYCKDSYLDHLCGHMHEPACTHRSLNGYSTNRISIAPSLFGLEYYNDKSSLIRIHGYNAGYYNIDAGKISKTIWPRISHRTQSNVLKIIQNDEFNLDKTTLSYFEVLKESFNELEIKTKDHDDATFKSIEKKGGNLFDKKNITDKGLVRSIYKTIPSHLSIRLHERMLAIDKFNSQKYCWLVTKFGLGEDEFIGSILSDSNINHGNCFSLNCEEANTLDDLINTFKNTFSQNITEFLDIINTLDRPLIVFNKLNDALINESVKLKEFIKTIFDFSSNLKIVIISSFKPDDKFFNSIDLFPLDVPAVKQFVENSQELHSTFTSLDFEKIHRLSSGIPLYVDKVIEQLKFRPLSDLGDMELETSSANEVNNILAKAIKNEIRFLQTNDNKQSNRKFFLLSILSLLHNGETFDRIKRFDSTKPFHQEDISYLLKNKLIETLQVNSIFDNQQNDSEIIKIIKVPRIIRDYVSSLIDEEEKLDIYKLACDLYLGNNWRNNIKLIQPKDAELDLMVYQNLQIAIRFILSHGIENKKETEIKRMTRISISLIEHFSVNGAYKDAISLIEETLLLIKDVIIDDFEDTRTFLTKKLGQNLRMTSFYDKSITILKSICDDENNSLSKSDRNDIRLSIAFAYDSSDKKDEAIDYANQIKTNEKNKNSSVYLSAEYVIAKFIEDETEKIRKLNSMKNKAEKLGFNTLKANIILEICRMNNDESNIKLLDKIIVESKNDIYTKVRAWAAKAEIVLGSKNINEITYSDLLGLNVSYTYSFYQRLQNLLNKCHFLAWEYWSKQKRYDQLLNLFRYSSFVWRLCGAQNQEKLYIDELHLDENFIEWFQRNKNGINSTYYEQRIFDLYRDDNDKKILEMKQ
ncbi:MAG: metallophosphoesterase [Bacteroidia bacterium]|nr:metallophosphoesterase [Bacteroidia bacterium]